MGGHYIYSLRSYAERVCIAPKGSVHLIAQLMSLLASGSAGGETTGCSSLGHGSSSGSLDLCRSPREGDMATNAGNNSQSHEGQESDWE